ncbi:MAG TPA: NfeD family protein [Bacteroidales bacterium]|nr:NfeD family protein [Bacteroidales bacterium]HOH21928.1 NfeD family protein [Bacteroidales bacterium]HPB58218.1 NfeD family protein [Bacteroidales bacterium]HPZ03541.1 NfeD family protein [Bacteroidales bacterium]HQB74849.1 NfeD family protein [Bacteroidales bacterium]
MGWFVIIFLIVLGVLALMLEVLVLPGGIVGIIGALFVIAGVILSYVHFGLWAGNITLLITAVFIIGTVILFLRSKTWKKMALTTEIDSKVNVLPSELEVGMEGVTISRLAPGGKALFGDQEVEVFSHLGFIDQNQEIVIFQIDENKIIVKLK